MKVYSGDWTMMKDDLEKLLDAGVFGRDYELGNYRYLATMKLEEIVESKLRFCVGK